MIRALEPWCSAFLYTNIDTEGLLLGMPLDVVSELSRATSRQLIVAGGIRTQEEVDQLDAMGVDAVVGMAIYLRSAENLILTTDCLSGLFIIAVHPSDS